MISELMPLKIPPALPLLMGGVFFNQSSGVSSLRHRCVSVVLHASRNVCELFGKMRHAQHGAWDAPLQ